MCLSTQMIISLTLYQMSDICVSGSLAQSPPHRDQPCWVRAASQARWGVLCELRLDRSINRIGALRMYFECSMSPWIDSNDVSRNVIRMVKWSNSGQWQAAQWVWPMAWSSSSPGHIPPSSVCSHCSPPHLDQWDNQSELGPTPVINSPSLLVKSEAAGSLSAACYDWNWRNVTTFVPWKWLCSVPRNNWDVRQ